MKLSSLSSLVLFSIISCLTSCQNGDDPEPRQKFRLSRITEDGAVVDIVYAGDGTVDSINTTAGEYWSQLAFSYDNGKLAEAVRYEFGDEFSFDRRHVYEYADGRLTKMRFYVPHIDYPDGYLVQYDTIIYNSLGQIAEVHNWTNGSRPELPLERNTVATYNFESEQLAEVSFEIRHGVGNPVTRLAYDNNARVSDDFAINFYLLHPRLSYIFYYEFPLHNILREQMSFDDGSQADEVWEYEFTYNKDGLPSSRKDKDGTMNFHYEPILDR